MESFFLISMMLNFLTDYIPDGSNIPVRDIQSISIRYIKSGFIFDIIPLLPIGDIIIDVNSNPDYKLFFLLKQFRIMKSIKLLDITFVIQQLKERSKQKLQKFIDENPEFREDNI